MSRTSFITIALVLSVVVLAAAPYHAQDAAQPPPAQGGGGGGQGGGRAGQAPGRIPEIDERTAGMQKMDGYFPHY